MLLKKETMNGDKMTVTAIEDLSIKEIAEGVLLVHQDNPPAQFSCCDGLLVLPKPGRNKNTVALDVNIEPKYVAQLVSIYGPVKDYVCTHGHMDHIAHVHAWEEAGATIHAPRPEHEYLTNLNKFYRGFGFNDGVDFTVVQQFGILNGYQPCKEVTPYRPGNIFKFNNLLVGTIPLKGHSKGHVGLLLMNERVFHISCLGFDVVEKGKDGFGPWYGFRECSLKQYQKDIDFAKMIFMDRAKILTSSHSLVVEHPDDFPFTYMNKKIDQNQQKIDAALGSIRDVPGSDERKIMELLKMDILFPKQKMTGFLQELYTLWEYWMLRHHLKKE